MYNLLLELLGEESWIHLYTAQTCATFAQILSSRLGKSQSSLNLSSPLQSHQPVKYTCTCNNKRYKKACSPLLATMNAFAFTLTFFHPVT